MLKTTTRLLRARYCVVPPPASKMLELAHRAGATVKLGMPRKYVRSAGRPGSCLMGCYDRFVDRIFVRWPGEMPPCIHDPAGQPHHVPSELLFERTVAHELIHWTGDAARLGRLSLAAYGLSLATAYEEGVAEAGALLLLEAGGFSDPTVTTVGAANVAYYAEASDMPAFMVRRDARAAVAYLNQLTA